MSSARTDTTVPGACAVICTTGAWTYTLSVVSKRRSKTAHQAV